MSYEAFFMKLVEAAATGLTLRGMDAYQHGYQPFELEGIP